MSVRARLAAPLVFLCAALTLVSPAAADAGQTPPTLGFATCPSTQVFVPAAGLECATLDVPFDRAEPAVGDVALAVQRVRASGPRTSVIVLLAGGPGQPALPAFEEVLAPLAREPALRGFELVAFDQRGTGQSEGLLCPETKRLTGGVSAYVGACGTALGATRGYYTSQDSVEDLDALRQALGGTPLSLFAVSYGTRVAGMYAREYPQGVARMVLDSVVPTTGPEPLELQNVHALRRVLDEGVCGAGACRSFSSDVYADLERLVEKLRGHPLRTRIFEAHGRLRPARVTERGLLSLLDGLDLAAGTRELAPAAIAAAVHGDAAPLTRLVYALQPEAPGRGGVALPAAASAALEPSPLGTLGGEAYAAAQAPASDAEISSALFTATFCVETDLPWSPEAPLSGRAATLHGWLASLDPAAAAPFSLATALADSPLPLCAAWPATQPAPPSPTGVSATPTLLLSGDDDLRTPYEQDLAIAKEYSDAQLLRIPDVGHSTVTSDQSGCAKKAMIEFLAGGQAPGSCSPSGEPQALALPPASLAKVPAAASSSHLAGQVANATAMTIEDLFGQTGFAGGGLRGGWWAPGPHGLVLHGMLDVPGVAVSGTIDSGDSVGSLTGHLSVGGRLAGQLTLRGLELSGRVGGARVHARLAAL
jgi:pimeloyl-ACP methyl ester carboxylesterase